MKCPSCKHVFHLGPPALGFSSAPGLFLIAGFVGLAIALGGYAMSESFPTIGVLLMICGGAFGFGALFLIPVAKDDASAHGPPKCPQCGAEVPVQPWSV